MHLHILNIYIPLHQYVCIHAFMLVRMCAGVFHVPICGIFRFGRMCGGVAPVPARLSKYLGLLQVQL